MEWASSKCPSQIIKNPQGVGGVAMTHNFSIINTSIPPPNFQPAVSVQLGSPQINSFSVPPGSQHVIAAGSFVQNITSNSPQLNSFPSNFLQSPPPPVTPTFIPNSVTSIQWNNQTYENNRSLGNPNFSVDPNCPGSNMHFPPPPQIVQSPPLIIRPPPQYAQPPAQIVRTPAHPLQWNNNVNFNQPPANTCFSSSNSSYPRPNNSEPSLTNNHVQNSVPSWLNFKNDNIKLESKQSCYLSNYNQNNHKSQYSINAESNGDLRRLQTTNVPDSNIFNDTSAVFNINQNSIDKRNLTYTNKFENRYFSNDANSNASSNSFTQAVNGNNGSYKKRKRPFIDLCNSPKKFQHNKINMNNNFSFSSNNNFNSEFKRNQMEYNWNNTIEQKNFISVNSEHMSNSRNKSFQSVNSNLIDIQVLSSNESNYDAEIKVEPPDSISNTYEKKSWNSDVAIPSDSESIKYLGRYGNSNFSKNINQHKKPFQKKTWKEEENSTQRNVKFWMTEDLKEALKKRNALLMKAKNSDDPELWKEFYALKNQINEDIRNAKANCRNGFKRANSVQNFHQSDVRIFQNSSIWPKKGCKPKERHLSFSCDMCDRGFPTDAEYQKHCALHIKCDYAGCSFEAHPKVIALHQKMQHDTGYADEINKLQNDEEIKKWREERKKRFPTAENILKRKAEKAEKEARGEVVETKVFGEFKKQKFENKLHQNQPRRRQRNRTRQPRNYNSRWNEKTPDSEEEDDIHIKLPRFKGLNANYELTIESVKDSVDEALVEISISRDSLDVNISDQQDPKNSVDEIPVEISISRDSLDLNKISDQQDPKSIEIDDEAPAEIPILRESLDQHESSDQQDSKNSDEEIPISKVSLDHNSLIVQENEDKNNQATSAELLPNPNSSTSNKKRNNDSSPNTKDRSNLKKRRNDRELAPQKCSVSLLEMLLDDEIRHERNVIMQATRYIVRNNFFNIGGTDKKNDK